MKKPAERSLSKPQFPWNTVIHTPCISLECTLFKQADIQVWCKLDYLNHPKIQGNKWHKLRYNLEKVLKSDSKTILTFGGAYSNHIAATAAAAKAFGLKAIGIIRDHELAQHPEKWSPTLVEAEKKGMELIFVDRLTYRLKEKSSIVSNLQKSQPITLIPEGGTNFEALKGFDELANQLSQDVADWTHIFCPVGTGGTLAGLYANLAKQTHSLPAGKHRKMIGIAVLKEADYLRPEINNLIKAFDITHKTPEPKTIKLELKTDYHCGSYGKTPRYLRSFQRKFEVFFGIPIDPIYNAKMLYGIYHEIKKGNLPAGSKVIIVHTGGLQGR